MADETKLYLYQQQIADKVKPQGFDVSAWLPRQSGATELACHLACDPSFKRVGIYAWGQLRCALIRDRLRSRRLRDFTVLDAKDPRGLAGATFDLVIIDGAAHIPESVKQQYIEPSRAALRGPIVSLDTYGIETTVVTMEDVIHEKQVTYHCTNDQWHLNYAKIAKGVAALFHVRSALRAEGEGR